MLSTINVKVCKSEYYISSKLFKMHNSPSRHDSVVGKESGTQYKGGR